MPKKRVTSNEIFDCLTIRKRLDRFKDDNDMKSKVIKSVIPGHYSEMVQATLIKRGKGDKYTDTQIRKIRLGQLYDREVWKILEDISEEWESDQEAQSPISEMKTPEKAAFLGLPVKK